MWRDQSISKQTVNYEASYFSYEWQTHKVKLKTDEKRITPKLLTRISTVWWAWCGDRGHTDHIQEILFTVWFSFMKTWVQFDWQHKEMRHSALTPAPPHRMWCLHGVSHTWCGILWTSVEVREMFRETDPPSGGWSTEKADYKLETQLRLFPLDR